MKNPLRIHELTAAEIPTIYPLIKLQNTWMTTAQFNAFLADMLPHGYHAVAVFDGERMVGVSGFWIRARFWCGRQFDIDNVIVHPDYRNKGVGKKLMTWLEKRAAAEKCELIVLDTYVTYAAAQRFYLAQGYALTGFHLTKIPGSTEIGKLPFSKV